MVFKCKLEVLQASQVRTEDLLVWVLVFYLEPDGLQKIVDTDVHFEIRDLQVFFFIVEPDESTEQFDSFAGVVGFSADDDLGEFLFADVLKAEFERDGVIDELDEGLVGVWACEFLLVKASDEF